MIADLRKEAEERRDRNRRDLRQALVDVLRTPAGLRLWLWVRLEACGTDKVAPAGDALVLARFEGRRDVGLDLDRALVPFPEIRMQLAQARAALDADDAIYQAAMRRDQEETSHAG